jgi:hypothetical protein
MRGTLNLAQVPLLQYRDSWGATVMYKPTWIARTPREHFMRAVQDEFSKFERAERAFRQADQDDRAAKLRLPVARNRPGPSNRQAEGALKNISPTIKMY